MVNYQGKTALITGASSGLGESYALALTDMGAHVILVARRADRLRNLADRISAKHGILAATVLPMDLSRKDAAASLSKILKGRNYQIDILINNAGFGHAVHFIDEDPQSVIDELTVNVSTLVELTHAFLPPMVERKDGIVINIASTAAFQSLPFMAVYAATKAFVLSFTEALWGEYRRSGVKILTVCPGPTATEFFDSNSNSPALGKYVRTRDEVIATTFRELAKARPKPSVVDGGLNKVTALSSRFFTRRFAAKLSAVIMNPNKKN